MFLGSLLVNLTRSTKFSALLSVFALFAIAACSGTSNTGANQTGQTGGDTGTLEVDWTIASSSDPAQCTTNGADKIVIQLTDSSGSTVGNGYMDACTDFATTISALAPDTYSVTAKMVDSSGADVSTTTPAQSVTVTAGATKTITVDFPANSFTGGSTSGTGTLEVDWTIAGSMDPTGCTTNDAANILITVTDSSGNAVGNGYMDACADFATTIPSLTPDTYSVTAKMVDSSGADVSTTIPAQSVTITADATQTLTIDFPANSFTGGSTTSNGTLEVDWTIASSSDSAQCTTYDAANIMVTVTDSDGKPVGTGYMDACSDFATSISDLAPGTYAVTAQMVDDAGDPVSTETPPKSATITAGQTTTVTVDFPDDSFTTSTSSTGTLEVDWTIAKNMDPSDCSAHGAANLEITLTDSTGTAYGMPLDAPCDQFAASVPDLPPDTYSVSLQMVDSSDTPVTTAATLKNVTITAGQITTQSFDFPESSFTM